LSLLSAIATAHTATYSLSLHDALPICNSSTSINKQLTQAVLKELDLKHHFIDLKSLDIPLFSEDLEKEIGSPPGVQLLKKEIERSEEHTSELQSRENLVCRLLLEKKKR